MKSINRKLVRDLMQTKTQSVAIALVVASGVAMLIMSLSTLKSLESTRNRYYDGYRFAHVFASMKRAPESLAERMREIEGIAQLETRIVRDVTLDLETLKEPAVGRLISLPARPELGLNKVFLRAGRHVELSRGNEVLVGEAFAKVHKLKPGDRVKAILNGKKQELKIVGIALSPEYILKIREGELLPDEKRFGIFWMNREELAAAFDMDGAFNNVTARLLRGASEDEVLERLDDLTEAYGGVGAYGRDQQLSHRYLSDEMSQLKNMGVVAPTIFFSVAAFLLNVVLSRTVRIQREQIAALKAFGYTSWDVGWHYLKFVLLISALGFVLGTIGGTILGRQLTVMYTRFYKFPIFEFILDVRVVLIAFLVSSLAASVGTFTSVRAAVCLPPAEAMRPEPPAKYRPTLVERLGLGVLLSPAARMIVRNLERQPVKALLSSLGIAMAVAVLILGSFSLDAIKYMVNFQFFVSQRYDMNVAFVEPTSYASIHEIKQLPGVVSCEPFRGIATKMRFGPRTRRVGIMGMQLDGDLFQLVDENENRVPLPEHGLMLSTKLAELLNVQIGDLVTVEVLEGDRSVLQIPVTALVTEFGGTNAYANLAEIWKWMREDRPISGAFLSVDENKADLLYKTLKETPRVGSVAVKQAALQSFNETIAENILAMRSFNIMFACIIAFGVVYNNARVSLSERSRELATLRVIGFTKNEISQILLGEIAVLTAFAIPFGLMLGYLFAFRTTEGLDTEVYRIPLIVNPSTYAFAAAVVILATIVSGLSVRRQLNRLDLVAVLKMKE